MNTTDTRNRLNQLAKDLLEAGDIAEVYFVAGELEKLAEEIGKSLAEGREQLRLAQEVEEENDYSDAMESMERKYWEGYTEALGGLMTTEEE